MAAADDRINCALPDAVERRAVKDPAKVEIFKKDVVFSTEPQSRKRMVPEDIDQILSRSAPRITVASPSAPSSSHCLQQRALIPNHIIIIIIIRRHYGSNRCWTLVPQRLEPRWNLIVGQKLSQSGYVCCFLFECLGTR